MCGLESGVGRVQLPGDEDERRSPPSPAASLQRAGRPPAPVLGWLRWRGGPVHDRCKSWPGLLYLSLAGPGFSRTYSVPGWTGRGTGTLRRSGWRWPSLSSRALTRTAVSPSRARGLSRSCRSSTRSSRRLRSSRLTGATSATFTERRRASSVFLTISVTGDRSSLTGRG